MDFSAFLSRLKNKCSKACFILPVLIGIALVWGLAERWVHIERQAKYENNIQVGQELAGFLHREVSETVLVVEDDPDLRILADNMLVELGYSVITAPSALEAAGALERQAVDLILSDVVLPGGASGPIFIAEARVGRPGLKAVFMSGYPADAIGEGKTLRTEDVLIQKPFNMRDLAHALHETLKQT